MDATSLLPPTSTPAPTPVTAPVLTPEQLAARKAAQLKIAKAEMLRKIAALKSAFEVSVAGLDKFLDQHPQRLTRAEILGTFTEEQLTALVALRTWAGQGIAAFTPPAPPAPAEGEG